MQSSAIYDPRASATPSQAQAADRRAARLQRIGSHARPDTPIVIPRSPPPATIARAEPAEEVVDRDLLFSLWVERQRQKHAEAAKEFLDSTVPSEPFRAPVGLIQKIVADHYGLKWTTMFTAVRTRKIARPRQIAMYLAKTLAPERSLPEIGRRFGGRDHTTILHAVRKIAELMRCDASLSADIEVLKSLIAARAA